MPFTAAQFGVNSTNATPSQIASLNQALNYLDQNFSANTILNGMVNNHTTIQITTNNVDQFLGASNVIQWDPNSGMGVINNGVAGVQSAAIGLIHEGAHSTDPNYFTETPAQRETYATNVETGICNGLSEPTRDSYTDTNGFTQELNPTQHTTSSNQWSEYEQNGTTTTGGTYTPNGASVAPASAPLIGGTVSASNETITVADGSTATIDGNGDTIVMAQPTSASASGTVANLTVVGNQDAVTTTEFTTSTRLGNQYQGATVNISGTGDSITGSFDKLTVSGNSNSVTLNGIQNNVTALGSGDNLTVDGHNVSLDLGSTDTVTEQSSASNIANVGGIQTYGTGTGDTVNVAGLKGNIDLSGATINVDGNYATVGIDGNNDAINGEATTNDGISVIGSGDNTTNIGSSTNIDITGNSDTAAASAGSTGLTESLNGTSDSATIVGSSTVTITGAGDSVTGTGTKDNVVIGVNDTSATANLSSGVVTLDSNAKATINGSSDSISTAATGVTAAVNGSGDSILSTAPSGDAFTVTGINDPFSGNSDAINYIGSHTGDIVTGSNNTGSSTWADPTGNPTCTGTTTVEVQTGTTTIVGYGGVTEEVPVYTEETEADPLVLNLLGGKVQASSLNNSIAYFDTENNGQLEKTSWTTAGEGVLVYDPGNSVSVPTEQNLIAGYGGLDALAGGDTGVLTSSSPVWNDIRVWVDATGTANPSQGQLLTLDQLGVASINLSSVSEEVNSGGSTIVNDGAFTFTNGKAGDIAGVDFVSSPAASSTPQKASVTSAPAQTVVPKQTIPLSDMHIRYGSSASNMDQLIQAMSTFAIPTSSHTGLPVPDNHYMQRPLLAVSR